MTRRVFSSAALIALVGVCGCSKSSSSTADPATVQKIREAMSTDSGSDDSPTAGFNMGAEGHDVTGGDIQVPSTPAPAKKP